MIKRLIIFVASISVFILVTPIVADTCATILLGIGSDPYAAIGGENLATGRYYVQVTYSEPVTLTGISLNGWTLVTAYSGDDFRIGTCTGEPAGECDVFVDNIYASDTFPPDFPYENIRIVTVRSSTAFSVTFSVTGGCLNPPPDPGDTSLTCNLVANADFTTTDGWLLDGTATITNSELSLATDDAASQNLNLSSQTTYNAVISVTSVTSSTNLAVGLGIDTEILTISTPGEHIASFTTGILAGPVAYSLENTTLGSAIDIDYTCLTLAATGPGGSAQYDCIYPANGSFTSADGWDFYRDAYHAPESQTAELPAADNGMIQSTTIATLPVTAASEYLLMSFDARGNGGDSAIGAGISAGGNDFTGYYQVYPTYYTYEANITNLAGYSVNFLSFANGIGYIFTDTLTSNIDVSLDNVCIFVADRPAQLPYQTDPNGITPVNMGFDFYSCSDVDAIWAGFGVNMAQYRANYAAGYSFWSDPIEWLANVFWVTLGDWSCMFVAALVSLINAIEYGINNGLNYGNWMVFSLRSFVPWLADVVGWLSVSWINLAAWWGDSWVATALWFVLLLNPISFLFSLPGIYTTIMDFFVNDGLDQVIREFENTIITIVNVWIVSWNVFLSQLGVTISDTINILLTIWNDSIYPVLQKVFNLSNPFLAIFAFLDLAWVIILWIWENAIVVLYIPVEFVNALNDGVSAPAYDLYSCSSGNLWCYLFAGLDMINQTASHMILYPAVIVLIIIGTIVLLKDTLIEFYEFVLGLMRQL